MHCESMHCSTACLIMPLIDLLMFQVCEIEEPTSHELHEDSTPDRAVPPSTDGMAEKSSIGVGALSFDCLFCSANSGCWFTLGSPTCLFNELVTLSPMH